MSKRLPVLSATDIAKALARVGFQEVPGRGKGSHIFVFRADPPKGITIPREREVKRGTLRAIIRQADLSVDEFVHLL
jgi:predicted RNA binding protein YcfA (HicA-like mRNA interferase family)